MIAKLKVERTKARAKEWRRRTMNELVFARHHPPLSLFLLDSKNNSNSKSEMKKEEKRKTFPPSHEARENYGKKFFHLSQRTMMMYRASRMGTKAVEMAVGREWSRATEKKRARKKFWCCKLSEPSGRTGERKNGRVEGFKHLSELIFVMLSWTHLRQLKLYKNIQLNSRLG